MGCPRTKWWLSNSPFWAGKWLFLLYGLNYPIPGFTYCKSFSIIHKNFGLSRDVTWRPILNRTTMKTTGISSNCVIHYCYRSIFNVTLTYTFLDAILKRKCNLLYHILSDICHVHMPWVNWQYSLANKLSPEQLQVHSANHQCYDCESSAPLPTP